ncbi:MAG: TOBE domain-containing protein [Chloroflexota bacterium]|nr:TOBE domain-containing protein [Chloroflexota bacterium]
MNGNGFSWEVAGDAATAVLRRPRVDRPAIAGARPEAMELSFMEQADYAKATIFAVEPMGSEVLVDVLLDEDTRIKARAEVNFAGQAGEAIWIRPKPDRIRLFDGESQEAIE